MLVPMRITAASWIAFAMLTTSEAFAFSPIVPQRSSIGFDNQVSCKATRLFSTKDNTSESEVERLLRKARELRAEAEAEEHAIHSSLIEKKNKRDAETDAVIQDLFFSSESLLDQLRRKRCSTDLLFRVVDRLHEREITAKGLEHVEPSLHHDHTKFKRIAKVNESELAQVEGLIDYLIEACAVLDDEWLQEKKKRGEKYITHTEADHWHVGECAKLLNDKVREMRREHEEQFQDRLNSFYEAQRKKDLPPPEMKP